MAISNSTDRFNGVIASLAIKAPCVAVAVANLTLSGEQTVNGVAVVAGDRVLVIGQTEASENGIYDASSSAWARAADWDGNRDVVSGTFVTVATATVGRNPYYQVTTANPITIGTTAVNFTLADGANVSIAISQVEIDAGLTVNDINDSFHFGEVPRYGTNTTPGTTNMSPAVTNALKTGYPVYVPPEVHLCDSNCPLITGSYIYGAGPLSILQHTTTNGVLGVLTVNRASPFGTTDPDDNIRDITIRDLKLLGTSVANGFSEFNHLMQLRAASDVVIERVHFEEFQGDGLYLGIGGNAEERHNQNITIRSCLFDGIDNTNRNGISVIDCDGCLIEDCYFQNCTTSGQPGAIDVEPNDVTQDIIRNITIKNNEFRKNGGGRAIAFWTPAGAMTAKPYAHFIIRGNYIHADNTFVSTAIRFNGGETVTEALDPMHLVIEDNTILSSVVGIFVTGIRGVKILNNTLIAGSVSQVGRSDNAALSVMDCEIAGNIWQDCSNTTGVLVIGSVEHLEIHNNTFNPKDTASHDAAIILFGSGVTTTSKYVSIHDNIFIKATNQTSVVKVSSHTQDPDTASYYNNKVVGGPIPINDFDTIATFAASDASPSVQNSDVFFSSTTGVTITQFDDGYIGQKITIISKGATVYDASTATRLIGSTVDITTASGDITTWVCEVGGTSSSVWRLTGFVDVSVDNSAGA